MKTESEKVKEEKLHREETKIETVENTREEKSRKRECWQCALQMDRGMLRA